MSMSRSNGRPEPEVIMNYNDGFAYSKGKMDAALASGVLEKPVKPTKEITAGPPLKKEDIDFIVQEFEISRAQAEKALHENGGDLNKTLKALVTP
ncbi:hypothetical protein C8J56DRAFT_349884 [Mycena floridula]|nr:hypothetical protein C8J56DRAFT_349884 [Mycena floridula]